MSSIKIISGTYGYSTTIYNTTFYTWVNNLASGAQEIYANDVFTQLGNEMLTAMSDFRGKAKFTFLYNLRDGERDFTSFITRFQQIFPLTEMSTPIIREAVTEPFATGITDSKIYINPGSAGVLNNCINYNNTNHLIVSNGYDFPYGRVYTSGATDGEIELPIYDDDGENQTVLYFDLRLATRGRADIYKRTALSDFKNTYPLWLSNIPGWADNTDPYKPGRTSEHGGGGRSFDDSSDPVGLPVPSTDYALNSGFLTMYQVNANKLNDLASFMWNTSLFDVEAWQKIMSNPFDAIISLTAIPASPGVLSDRAIKIGNVVTNVSAPVVADQFVRINCGTLDVEEYSGSYLDYSPYTRVEIYLPYIGFRDLNTDEVMDKTLSLVYNVDVLSGACVANILVGDTVLYQFAGDCAMQIPVTGRDPAKTLTSILGVVTSAGSLAGGAILGTLNPQSAVKAVTATAESVIGGKRNIQRSGNISGSAGFMGGQTPYLIITRPRQALPEEQNTFMGYPSFITSTLGDLSGMTIIADCHLENIPCTDGELQEIERLLKEGVIL